MGHWGCTRILFLESAADGVRIKNLYIDKNLLVHKNER